MKRVIAFGAFDPLNEGQKDFIRQAKKLGDYLIVVVAHDSAIRAHKGRDPKLSEEERMESVRKLKLADEVILGRKTANRYHVMGEVDFDIVAMGYNQKPSDEEVRQALEKMGKYNVQIIRCKEYVAEKQPIHISKMAAISLVVVLVLVLLGIFMALNSAGRSTNQEAQTSGAKLRFEVVSGWKTSTFKQYGNLRVQTPIGLEVTRFSGSHAFSGTLTQTADTFITGTTIFGIVRDSADRASVQSFMQSRKDTCQITSAGAERFIVQCSDTGQRLAYIPGGELDIFVDASTLDDGTDAGLSSDELVRFVSSIEF